MDKCVRVSVVGEEWKNVHSDEVTLDEAIGQASKSPNQLGDPLKPSLVRHGIHWVSFELFHFLHRNRQIPTNPDLANGSVPIGRLLGKLQHQLHQLAGAV